ncbi:MAG TPA: DUF1684 domain-containing protein [Acidimicrobiales bacterium]
MALTLLDWRRQVAALYAGIRANPDPVAAHAHWRTARDRLLREHSQSPIPTALRSDFPGAVVAEYNPGLRFDVAVDPHVEPRRLEIETGTDGLVTFDRVGRLHLPGLGDLDAWWLRAYGGGLFVPFRDSTAGAESYGGGRYLLDTAKGADLGGTAESLVIDFNFAYNPSCAYDPAWACPLAPAGNVLDQPIRAGELAPR